MSDSGSSSGASSASGAGVSGTSSSGISACGGANFGGISAGGNFAASASGNSAGNSTSSYTSIGTSYSVSSYTTSTSSSASNANNQAPSPNVSVSFNNNVTAFSSPQTKSKTFNEINREQIAAKNEKAQALYANEQNWEHQRGKIAAKAQPMPTYELDNARNRNINLEYEIMLTEHQRCTQNIEVSFDRQIESSRTSGITLADNFEKSTEQKPPALQNSMNKYQRPTIINNFNDHTNEKDRGR